MIDQKFERSCKNKLQYRALKCNDALWPVNLSFQILPIEVVKLEKFEVMEQLNTLHKFFLTEKFVCYQDQSRSATFVSAGKKLSEKTKESSDEHWLSEQQGDYHKTPGDWLFSRVLTW
jgi:hypothetical protein